MALTPEEEDVAKNYLRAARQKEAEAGISEEKGLEIMLGLAKTANVFTPQLIQKFRDPENKTRMDELQAIVDGE
jgi:hypothetical protein